MTLSMYHSQAMLSSLSNAGLQSGSTTLIPPTFQPTTELRISYGEKDVELGSFFTTTETKNAPTVEFAGEGFPASYTLLLVDPDPPTPEDPKFAYWRHWIISGLQASASGKVAFSKKVVTTYLGPGAKDETATPHRYVFLLYREPAGLELSAGDVGGEEFVERRSFKAVEFVEKQGLALVAVNWFSGVGDGWKM